MADKNDTMEDIEKRRISALKKYKCPLCGSNDLTLRSETYFLARPYRIDSTNIDYHLDKPIENIVIQSTPPNVELRAKQGDSVKVADCMNCGFILHFNLGTGPA